MYYPEIERVELVIVDYHICVLATVASSKTEDFERRVREGLPASLAQWVPATSTVSLFLMKEGTMLSTKDQAVLESVLRLGGSDAAALWLESITRR